MKTLNIKGWKVEVRSDLYLAGKTEDGEDYTAECYYVTIERSDGKMYAHNEIYYGAKREETENGYPIFLDYREDAKIHVDYLKNRIKGREEINLDYWSLMEPSYGSEYYCKVNGF